MKVRKILATFLSLCMVIGTMAVPVFAEDETTVQLPDEITEADFKDGNVVTDGTNYYKSMVDALKGIHKKEVTTLYCKPGANLGQLQHGHVCADLTVYGNGAYIEAGQDSDFELDTYKSVAGYSDCSGIEKDLTITLNELGGAAVWGERTTANTLNIVLNNCEDLNRVYITGTTGKNNITLKNCSFVGGSNANNCTVYSNAGGTVTVKDCTFENVSEPININNKSTDTSSVSVSGTNFVDCGLGNGTDDAWAAPIRIVSSKPSATTSATTSVDVDSCTFDYSEGKASQNGDILLGDGREGNTSYPVTATITSTEAEVQVQNPGDQAAGKISKLVSTSAEESYSVSSKDVDTTMTWADFVTAVTKAGGKYDGNGITVQWKPVSGCDNNTHTDSCPDNIAAKTGNTPDRVNNSSPFSVQYEPFKTADFTDVEISNVNFVFVPASGVYCSNSGYKGAFDAGKQKMAYLQLQNTGKVTFKHCNFDKVQVGAWNAEETTVENCSFKNVGSYALHWLRSEKTTVKDCTFTDCRSAILIATDSTATQITITGNEVEGETRDFIQFAAGKVDEGIYTGANITIADNKADSATMAIYQLNTTIPNANVVMGNNENISGYYNTPNENKIENNTTVPVAKIGDNYYTTLAAALDAAANGDTIELISGDTPIRAAGKVCGNKTVTITGKAVFDWSGNDLKIGRGAEGDGKLIFDGADIKSSSKATNTSTGFHVSGTTLDNEKNNGTLVIKNSNMEIDYMIDRNAVTVEKSNVVIYNGCWIHGRNAIEAESGSAATATFDIKDNSSVEIVRNNGMGVGGESFGKLDIDSTSTLITDETYDINGNGSLTSAGCILGEGINVKTDAEVKITDGTYSFDPTPYIDSALNKQVVKDEHENLWFIADKWELSATADKDTVYADEEVTVTVKATGANYAGATWTLAYDKDEFECVSQLTVGNEIQSFEDGIIRGYKYGPDSGNIYNNDTVLATYKFKAKALKSEFTGDFKITDGTVGTVDMSKTSYPPANVAAADSVKILLRDFKVTAKLDGTEITGTAYEVPFDNKDHTITVETEPAVTDPVAIVHYSVNGEAETTTAPTFKNAGKYTIKYWVDVPAGYKQDAKTPKTITFTIGAPKIDVEIADYTDNSKLVLVYTNTDGAVFEYGKSDELMYDVTDAGYEYKQTKYTHVYGYVVPNVLFGAEYADDAYYKSQIKFVQGGTPVVVAYDENVNCHGDVDIADVIYTIGFYEGTLNNNDMQRLLKADVDHSKKVNGDDATLVKNAWLNIQ